MNHVTSDTAHQERIDHLSTYENTQDNSMPSQTFRTDEQVAEHAQLHPLQTEISLQMEIEGPQRKSMEFDEPKFWTHLDKMQKVKSQRKEKPAEEEPKKDSSEEGSSKNGSYEEGSSEKSSSEDATSIAKPLICWEGISVVDELGVTNFPLSKPRLFHEFEKAYRYNHCYPKNPDKIKMIYSIDSEFKLQKLISNTSYKYSKNNPMFKSPDAYKEGVNAMEDNAIIKAILCFEAAVQKDPHNINKLFKLCEALLRNQEPRSALSVANEILELAPNHPIPHYCKTMIYNNQKCDYQTCQSVFNWLKYHNSYRDIIPPNFEMEDKTTTDLDEGTLNAVKKMLIKAAPRNPINPDLYVQYFLGILCTISDEYDKAVDCLRLVLKNTNQTSRQAKAIKLKMSQFLFFANKPKESLDLLFKASETLEFEDYQKIGFIYIYLKDYKQAALYLTTGLNKKYTNTVSNFEMFWKDTARLALCVELLGRKKFRGPVKDFEKNFPAFFKLYLKKFIRVQNVVHNSA